MMANRRLMGLDVGEKRIGVAVSDELLLTAQPVETIERVSFEKDCRKIAAIAAEKNCRAIVIGYPRHMHAEAGDTCDMVDKFAEKLAKYTDLEFIMWDERLTSVQAEAALISMDLSRKKRKQLIDRAAATIILQSYLDHIAIKPAD